MNYEKHYNKLIQRCKDRTEVPEYVERHHIVPRCMGGKDVISNMVALTPEEHFVAHQLLYKMHPDNKKLLSAVSKMCSSSSKNPRTNKWYGWIRRRYSESVAGENNPSAKFTNAQVLEIYHSDEHMDILAERYGVLRYNIITIKRKIYYRNVTKDISELPGYCEEDSGKGKNIPIPIDLISEIFYDTGDYDHFWKKYRASEVVVRNIKRRKTSKSITSKLTGDPGQVKRYKLTNDMVQEVYYAKGTPAEIAEKYGIHYNTVRNIKGKYNSRAHHIWEEF